MTIGRIKIEALKLMFLNARDIHEDELTSLGADQNYSDYLASMPGCIHRALQDMVLRKILPKKVYVIDPYADGEWVDGGFAFDTSRIADLHDVARIVKHGSRGYVEDVGYDREGDRILIFGYDTAYEYRVIYDVALPAVDQATPNDMQPDIPEPLAVVIPYFIKAELFTSDTPSNAAEAERARGLYETALARYAKDPPSSRRVRIKTVFGGW